MADQLSERAALIATLEAAISGPAAWGICDPELDPVEWFRQHLSFGSGDIHVVWLPQHPLTFGEHPRPEHAILLCLTGNGPTSEANAKAIAAVWNEAANQLRADAEEIARLRDRLAAYETAKSAEVPPGTPVPSDEWKAPDAR